MREDVHRFAIDVCTDMLYDEDSQVADVMFSFLDDAIQYHRRCLRALTHDFVVFNGIVIDADSVVFTMTDDWHLDAQQFFIEQLEKHENDERYQMICRHHREARIAVEAKRCPPPPPPPPMPSNEPGV